MPMPGDGGQARRLPLSALLLVVTLGGCYDPPVTETVLLSLEADGRVTLSIETAFRQSKDLKHSESSEIERVIDRYELGRDPWLRGFEKAEATGITHEYVGDRGSPRGITRGAILPSVETIALVMPDAIANFRLLRDADAGTETLRITHIDIPESLRDRRKRVEREVEAFARIGYRFSEAHCDMYEYLADHVDRRHDLLQALEDEDHITGLLAPGETVLIAGLRAALEALMEFGRQEAPPVVAGMAFAPFDHGFCLRLPPDAEMLDTDGFAKVEGGAGEKKRVWCAPQLTLENLIDDVFARADPPLLDETLLQDASRLDAAPFTCVRHIDERALEDGIWDRILPRSRYEITWRIGGRGL